MCEISFSCVVVILLLDLHIWVITEGLCLLLTLIRYFHNQGRISCIGNTEIHVLCDCAEIEILVNFSLLSYVLPSILILF